MDTRALESKLASHKLFKDLKESVKESSSGKLRNLIEIKDDVLYAWYSVENCLLSLNLKRLEEDDPETPYEKLHLLTPPAFTVDRVIGSACGTRICVWGPRGVTVAELPSRWARGGLFDATHNTVLCKSYSLDERFLYSQGEVRRVHWHPSSLSHILVLVSDNTIRLYNIAQKSGPKLVKILNIGPKPSSLLAGKTILDSLGDTAVDFTSTPDSNSLLILRGNGDVYMMDCDLEGKSGMQPLSAPLAMYPPADDNYGSDSCCICALGTGDAPPLVVVATSSGSLYHCLLLPNSSDKEEGDSHALYVVEAVELSIVLSPDNADLQYSYPVHLYPCSKSTYACTHAGGLHAVTVPILGHLKEYALANEEETETCLSAMSNMTSSARQLVRTALNSPQPPIGLAATGSALPALILLNHEAQPTVRCLEPHNLEEQLYKELQLSNPALEQEDIDKILKERQKLSFTSIVQELLNRDVSQPILSLGKSQQHSAKESLEFLTQATLKLRGEYIFRQERVCDVIAKKLNNLIALGKQHDQWFQQLKHDIEDVQLQSTVLKEKCALAEKYQDDMKYRCSAVIRMLRASATATPEEREVLASLEKYRARSEHYAEEVALLKQHAKDKSCEMKKWQEEYKKKDIALGKSHSDTISSILQQQTKQISSLIEETKILKDQLSIV